MDNKASEEIKKFQAVSLLEEISKEIAELESKLSPVLLSNSPSEKSEEENKSDLMRGLRSICGRIVNIKSRIDL